MSWGAAEEAPVPGEPPKNQSRRPHQTPQLYRMQSAVSIRPISSIPQFPQSLETVYCTRARVEPRDYPVPSANQPDPLSPFVMDARKTSETIWRAEYG
jgi:hypothetical protein